MVSFALRTRVSSAATRGGPLAAAAAAAVARSDSSKNCRRVILDMAGSFPQRPVLTYAVALFTRSATLSIYVLAVVCPLAGGLLRVFARPSRTADADVQVGDRRRRRGLEAESNRRAAAKPACLPPFRKAVALRKTN
jgi:hypothetical protein